MDEYKKKRIEKLVQEADCAHAHSHAHTQARTPCCSLPRARSVCVCAARTLLLFARGALWRGVSACHHPQCFGAH